MKILGIDTSCDETSASVVENTTILSNVLFSQVEIHKKWGGVVPNLAKWAHEERIDSIINQALSEAKSTISDIDAIAVTYGPGLSVALGVGIDRAKKLGSKHNKRIIAVNHMEGHIYSCFAKNVPDSKEIDFNFPYLVLLVSGKHSDLVLFKDHINYEILGKTLDDASGEALDKGARLILNEKVYPGGPIIESLANKGNSKFIHFPRPMVNSDDLNFSFAGLKTSLFYAVKKMTDNEREQKKYDLSASYQEAIIDTLCLKLNLAIKKTNVKNVCVAGGVAANKLLRQRAEKLVNKVGGTIHFPLKGLYGDNGAMIAVAGCFKAQKGMFVKDVSSLDRTPRASLSNLETC